MLCYTQFVVESVFVIVLASVLLKLRLRGRGQGLEQTHSVRWALPVALLFGAVVALWLLVASGVEFNPQLHQFFAQVSVPEAHGRNVVNVVLVDFRAIDTLGEIVVVTISFIAAIALLQSARSRLRRDRAAQAGGAA